MSCALCPLFDTNFRYTLASFDVAGTLEETMAAARVGNEALPGDEFLDALEEVRRDFLGGKPFRERKRGQTTEQIAADKRRRHLGGDGNHRFNGERFLNCDDKEVRRGQLRTLVDEGGQTSVGGKIPGHPRLEKWNSVEFGLTDEEIDELEKRDAPPESLIVNGWWYWLHRTAPWQVTIGSALVGEGEKRLPEVKERYLRDMDETREEYEALGIKNIDRAMALMIEHAPTGVDAEHSEFAADVAREHLNTPELQEEMRKAFILNLHGRGNRTRF
jgi:pyrroloquinoline quinone (PQQ) biosynthesis protein C